MAWSTCWHACNTMFCSLHTQWHLQEQRGRLAGLWAKAELQELERTGGEAVDATTASESTTAKVRRILLYVLSPLQALGAPLPHKSPACLHVSGDCGISVSGPRHSSPSSTLLHMRPAQAMDEQEDELYMPYAEGELAEVSDRVFITPGDRYSVTLWFAHPFVELAVRQVGDMCETAWGSSFRGFPTVVCKSVEGNDMHGTDCLHCLLSADADHGLGERGLRVLCRPQGGVLG